MGGFWFFKPDPPHSTKWGFVGVLFGYCLGIPQQIYLCFCFGLGEGFLEGEFFRWLGIEGAVEEVLETFSPKWEGGFGSPICLDWEGLGGFLFLAP